MPIIKINPLNIDLNNFFNNKNNSINIIVNNDDYNLSITNQKCVVKYELDKNKLYVEKSYEGTLIRMYYYEDKWMYSTKKCINASKSK